MSYEIHIESIEILGQNDEHIPIHEGNEGERGVHIAEDGVDTLFNASPEKQTWKSGARSKGSKPRNRKILHRDIDLSCLVKETQEYPYEFNESYLLQAVGWELDPYDDDAKLCRIRVTTDLSGPRDLDVVQYEEPEFSPKIDPIKQQFGEITLKLRCGDPDWYEDDWISPYEFSGAGEGWVEVWNPTPRAVYQTWGVTPGVWSIPDPTWRGAKGDRRPGGPQVGRILSNLEVVATDGYTQFNRNRDLLPAVNENDTNITARMNGQFVLNEIPPYTQKQRIPVWKEDSGAGRIELIQARRWQRPWGGELHL